MDENRIEELMSENEQPQKEAANQERAGSMSTQQLERQIAALEDAREELKQIRRGDKLATGVVGALIGALITLLIMIPCVFLLKGPDSQSGTSQGSGGVQQENPAEGLAGEFDTGKLTYILQLLDTYFLYDTDIDAIEDAVFHSLMSSLGDAYACYYNEEEFKELQESNEGTYYGIGVMVSQNLETNIITVTHVFRESPAEEAGIRQGDTFEAVAGLDVLEMELDDVVALIKGEEGSTVTVTVYRESTDEHLTIEVERRQVEQDMVYWNMLEDNIGYIQLIQFTGNAADQLSEALADLGAQGMEGLILDLRGNPGGLLTSVIDVGGQLLPGGTLLTIKSNYTKDKTYSVEDSGFDYPLVVLVDGNSASASEVLTGAIQDYGVGTIVGTTTFGKGIVQDIIILEDGVTGVKFTTADYYTPSGRNIHGTGIEPDVIVEWDGEEDNQLEKAVEVLKEKIGQAQ